MCSGFSFVREKNNFFPARYGAAGAVREEVNKVGTVPIVKGPVVNTN